MTDDTNVKVVVRIRPQNSRDILDLCHVCTTKVQDEPQIWLGKDRAYTFDEVFDMNSFQDEIYDRCVKELVDGVFMGYNATVLAYGQTGSGKTYTMGTGFDHNFQQEERGIIPRAVEHLFKKISKIQREAKENDQTPPEFKINVQFMELYNEVVVDLLDTTSNMDNKGKKEQIKIHEDADGKIYAQGVIAQCVTSIGEALQCLKVGSLSRTTASTNMNTQSSRSHAIFTIHIKQQRIVKMDKTCGDSCNTTSHEHNDSLNEYETLTAKFHFVDLAGSERLKRTRATGERQKESICINSGLLALSNVISALGDKSKKSTHVPYRDSKLTRLLQDSLGGNSRTLMIACVSPSDRDFMETLSTLKYANRAKNIKNKVSINMDKSSQKISMLIQKVESLQLELMEFKQGKRIIGDDGTVCVNDMYHENTLLQTENNSLKTRIKALQETIDRLTAKNTELLVEKQTGQWIIAASDGDKSKADISMLIQGYVLEIESLRAKLMEYEETCSNLRKNILKNSPLRNTATTSTVAITGQYDIRVDASPSVYELIEEAKEDIRKLKRKKKMLKCSNIDKENLVESDEDKDIAEENEDNEDENMKEESSSDSDTENTDQNEKFGENLADLTCEISLKQKLIDQLEMSQRRLQNMRQHYEEKLIQLQNKIQETERERTRVLANLSKSTESESEEKVRRVREDFEKKLNALKNDVKTLQMAKKEHAQLMKNQADYEKQLKKLKLEVADMKRAKVALVNKMKEEAKKYKDAEMKRNKQIAQLQKEKISKDSKIKALEADKKKKENLLKRRTEEIKNLRKKPNVRHSSPREAARSSPSIFSPRLAKQKWQALEKKINRLVLNKQSIATIEKDMDHWLREREKLSRCLTKTMQKRDRALMEQNSAEVVAELEDEIENLRANIEYVHENVSDCQTSVMQMEEAKEHTDFADISNTIKNIHFEESHYLLEKLLNMAINQSFQAAQKEILVKELESQLKQVIENNAVQEQLLYHVVHEANEHLSGFIELSTAAEDPELSKSYHSSGSSSPVDSNMSSFSQEHSSLSRSKGKQKARKVAATKEQLLFSSDTPSNLDATKLEKNEENRLDALLSSAIIKGRINGDLNDKSRSYVVLPATDNENIAFQKEIYYDNENKNLNGQILAYMPNPNAKKTSYLKCTHIAEGHNRAVLCVECTEEVFFSGSEDRTVKIWDLSTGKEIQRFQDHPSSVVKVRYCEYTRLAFSASSHIIKVWDTRQNPSICVQTFWSSGQAKKNLQSFHISRYNYLSSEEHQINDIALNHYGTVLFSASTNVVRMWDLRTYQSIGTLNVGYSLNPLCLAVDDMKFDKNRIVCGSNDNSIKVFEVLENSRGIHYPKFELIPPHYDDVQALVINGDFLFSASRDKSIKKWDLRRHCLEHSHQQAHKDSIRSLNVCQSGDFFISGCHSGYIKLWSTEKCELFEEIRAHESSINSIVSNNNFIFTASSDTTIGLWQLGSSEVNERGFEA